MNDTRPYHHGALRQTLIDAAIAAVSAEGHEALSLRALADVAGVARSAPYRHFPEKNALLAEVAQAGFRILSAALAEIGLRQATPRERLLDSGRVFLDFAASHRGLFRLMFEAGLQDDAAYPAVAAAQRDTYDQLAVLYAQHAPQASAHQRRMRLVALWSTLYGYARINDRKLLQPYMVGEATPAEMEAAVLEAMLH